ncbi:MAG: hypothetical protein FRX49_02170 [Trebouxia sp. A1-2]|nr:MAG: hypothetical protein FRX49_02170 [Trebouxia sp. A1-2]
MTLPSKNIASVAPLVGVILLGWIVELFGLFYLQKSCRHHATPAWATAAGFPAVSSCWKLYRFEWLTIFFEFVIVLGLLFSLTKANAIRRFRLSFLGLLAISAVLHIFATNSTLNLQDTVPTGTFLTHTEHLRARIVSGSFAFGAAFTIALLIVLGEDDAQLGSGSELDNQQPLINNELARVAHSYTSLQQKTEQSEERDAERAKSHIAHKMPYSSLYPAAIRRQTWISLSSLVAASRGAPPNQGFAQDALILMPGFFLVAPLQGHLGNAPQGLLSYGQGRAA